MAFTSAVKPLSCAVESPQYLSIGDSLFHSGCAIIEVQFPNHGRVDIGKIRLVNNYTAHISLKMKIHEKSSNGESTSTWKTCLRKFVLMPNPHCESGSQGYFTLMPKDFCRIPSSVSALRFILRQPSPNWKTFSLEELYIYPALPANTSATSIPRWLLESQAERSSSDPKSRDHAEGVNLPDPDDVSRHLQQLLMLSEKAQDSQPTVELGRFDVDGCYEINLLSYT